MISLHGDSCAASNLTEAEIDERVQLTLDMDPEDPNTVNDLRCLNFSAQRANYVYYYYYHFFLGGVCVSLFLCTEELELQLMIVDMVMLCILLKLYL